MNQHYVPRVYLKNFSEKRKNEYFIKVYEKETQRKFESNIRKVCGVNNLYTLEEGDSYNPNPLVIEKGYAEFFEPLYNNAYNILIDDRITNITPKQRVLILTAVFQFYFRNTKILNESIEYHIDRINYTYKQNVKNGIGSFEYLGQEFYTLQPLEEQIEKYKKQSKYQFKTGHVQGFYKLIESNIDQAITIYKLVDESKFITSDNPMKNSNLNKLSKNPFQSESQFFLPLNDKYALFLHNNKNLSKLKIHRDNSFNGRASIVNGHMINNCQKFVFGDQEEIRKELWLQDVMKTEYEDNDEKFVQLMRETLRVMQIQKGPMQLIELTTKLIRKYDSTGKLTRQERQEFYNKGCKLMENEWRNKI